MTFTEKKRASSLRNLELAAAANAARRQFGVWRCATCGKEAPATVHQKRQTYCSRDCMSAGYMVRMRGAENPNYRDAARRVCKVCGSVFQSYQKGRLYCSMGCRDKGANHLRTGARKDANHHAIVAVLKAGGAVVIDLSKMAGGVPDILVWHREAYHLVEIKNPKTAYGKRGLNKLQREWADNWNTPVYVIRSNEDAELFLAGRYAEIDSAREKGAIA